MLFPAFELDRNQKSCDLQASSELFAFLHIQKEESKSLTVRYGEHSVATIGGTTKTGRQTSVSSSDIHLEGSSILRQVSSHPIPVYT